MKKKESDFTIFCTCGKRFDIDIKNLSFFASEHSLNKLDLNLLKEPVVVTEQE